jgi:hypothetical protein
MNTDKRDTRNSFSVQVALGPVQLGLHRAYWILSVARLCVKFELYVASDNGSYAWHMCTALCLVFCPNLGRGSFRARKSQVYVAGKCGVVGFYGGFSVKALGAAGRPGHVIRRGPRLHWRRSARAAGCWPAPGSAPPLPRGPGARIPRGRGQCFPERQGRGRIVDSTGRVRIGAGGSCHALIGHVKPAHLGVRANEPIHDRALSFSRLQRKQAQTPPRLRAQVQIFRLRLPFTALHFIPWLGFWCWHSFPPFSTVPIVLGLNRPRTAALLRTPHASQPPP